MKLRHHELDVWQAAVVLVKEVYRVTATFPNDERFGLTSQMRRAAVSIPSNIAEGAARSGDRELAQFLTIARGSLMELETQLHLAAELGFIDVDARQGLEPQVEKVFALLTGLMNSVKRAHPAAKRWPSQ